MTFIRRNHAAATAIVVTMSLSLAPGLASAAPAEPPANHSTVADALRHGTFGVALLYRIEQVSDDAFTRDATGSKLRTTVSYRSGGFRDLAVTLELEDVSDLGARNRHDNGGVGSLGNGVTDRPVIADPDLTEVQQLNVEYRGVADTVVTVGRQELSLANQRFVGPVGWRMNHQSFDAIRIEQEALPRTGLSYVYIDRANTVVNARRRMSSHALLAAVDAGRWGTVTPYWYDLDLDAAANAALSTRTVGASWTGAPEVAGWKLPFRLELAQQDDAADNPATVDAGYRHLTIGAERERWAVTAGLEVLEGDPVDGAFSTPLATLHGFNGWADQFLATPANGLEDRYLAARYRRGGLTAELIVHDFGAESSGPDHGHEIDGVVSYRAPWDQLFAVTFALFDADSASPLTDLEKLWFSTSYRF